MSARCTSEVRSSPRVTWATPTLMVALTDSPPISKRYASILQRARSATFIASPAGVLGITIANSSPP